MPQSFNWNAIRTSARVLLRQPSLAVPHIEVRTVADLDFAALRRTGCHAVVFDKDNTLTAPYADALEPSLTDALAEAREAFDGRVAVLSNSAGTPDDPGHRQALRVERALGLPVLRRPEKKPGGFEAVRAHFGRDTEPATLVMVGDRYLTDVVFGNLHGMLTVHTRQLTRRGDNRVAQSMRALEDRLLAIYRRAGVRPPRHRLADAARDAGCRAPTLPTRAGGAPRMSAADAPRDSPAADSVAADSVAGAGAGARMLALPRWAVVGDVLHPRKPARAVAERLEAAGKVVVRVHPRASHRIQPHIYTCACMRRGLGGRCNVSPRGA
jgi:phosphatidylglycerophosphatase GEP4